MHIFQLGFGENFWKSITCILKANLQWQNIWKNKLFFSRKNKLFSKGRISLIHILQWSLLLQLFKPNGLVWVYNFSDVQSLAMGRQNHTHSGGHDGKKKGSRGLERASWDTELRVLWLQTAVAGAHSHYTQYPVSQLYSSWGTTSAVPITDPSAAGWFWEHLGSSELQKQMSNIPNLLCSY